MKVKDVAMSVKSTFESSQGKGFSLKQLAVLCNVTKRRLYDIVNVLEVFELVKTVRYNDGKYVYFLGLDKDKLIELEKYIVNSNIQEKIDQCGDSIAELDYLTSIINEVNNRLEFIEKTKI